MKILALFVVTVVTVFGVKQNDLASIIQMVIAETDINDDGIISEGEFQNEFLSTWDSDLNGIITRNEFMDQWVHRYGDKQKDATTFFENLDENNDGKLTSVDLLFFIGTLDIDGNGEITVSELEAFIRSKHPRG